MSLEESACVTERAACRIHNQNEQLATKGVKTKQCAFLRIALEMKAIRLEILMEDHALAAPTAGAGAAAAVGPPPRRLPDLAAAIMSSSFFLRASSSFSAYCKAKMPASASVW